MHYVGANLGENAIFVTPPPPTLGCDAELRFSGPLFARGRYHYFPPGGVWL